MRKRLTIAAALALMTLPFTQATAQEPRPGGGEMAMDVVPMLTVSGSGEARVAPDEATVRLGVVAQAPTARAAQDQVNRAAGAVLEAIRKLDVKAEDIQTSGLSLQPLYSQGRPGTQESQTPRITGYQANNTVTIRTGDLTKVGPIIDAGLGAGANTLDGVDFGLRNDEAARAQALADAALKARAKAQTLAKALGLSLGSILEVAEGGISVSPPPYPRGGMLRMAAESAMADTPVSAGQVGVQASVTIRYRISQ
ncbi:MAG TPA: SIMPL domain-containing protein [Thermoanaerobaculia bacterium]|nr:SIMPL domain-containing protein [Thermoanaerobaculia bacterium]